MGAIFLVVFFSTLAKSQTPDFQKKRVTIRTSFVVPGSIQDVRNKIVRMPQVLSPGTFEVQADDIIVAYRPTRPAVYDVVYLSLRDAQYTLVEVGIYASVGFTPATWGSWFGNTLETYLNGVKP